MTGRPCNPDADLKGLWRMLLGTPFPACGIAEDAEAASGDSVEAKQSKAKQSKAKQSPNGSTELRAEAEAR